MTDADAHPPARGEIVRALGSIGSATLLSRVLGFLRDLVVAQAFGAGPATDAFFVAFRLPNLLRRLVGETDAVFSLAGKTSHIESMLRPEEDLEHNVRAALNTLQVGQG